jgi:membrane-bound metal-dependent hydrolase YbcI (DUF457 family)
MDDKPVNPESPPQPAKRCFVVCLGIALACGVLAALTWLTNPGGFPGGVASLLLSIFLTVVADVSFVIAIVALLIWNRKRGVPPVSPFSIQVIIALVATTIILTIDNLAPAEVMSRMHGGPR